MSKKSLTSPLTLSLIVPLAVACARDAEDTVPSAEWADASTDDPTAVSKELATSVEQYIAAWNGNDPAAVAEFFTADATARVGDDTFTQDSDGQWRIRSAEVMPDAPPQP